MKLALVLTILLASTNSFAEDILPFRFEYQLGEVQPLNEDSLTYIDNSPVYLNPDTEGKHDSQFIYKSKMLNDVPYLEVRTKGLKGQFEVSISQGNDWHPVGIIVSNPEWKRQKFDLQDHLSAFADKEGNIKVRIKATGKDTKSLEIDYIGITTDKPKADEKPAETAGL